VIRWHDLAALIDRAENDEVGARAQRADLGHFERSESAREGELCLVGHVLAAKYNDRMLLERCARLLVCGGVGRDLGKCHAAQLGGEARTQRDDLHRRALRCFGSSTFPQNRPASKERLSAMLIIRACPHNRQHAF
jgi:hypothetical protein